MHGAMRSLKLSTVMLLIVSLMVTAGCSDDSVDVSILNDSNMKRLRNFYELYMNENGGVGPDSEKELREYILNGRKAKILTERSGWDPAEIDNLFIGERDNEAFRIRYGLEDPLNHAIVFEETGVDGKRYVAFSTPEELDANDYEAWWTGEKKPKPLPTLGEVMKETQ